MIYDVRKNASTLKSFLPSSDEQSKMFLGEYYRKTRLPQNEEEEKLPLQMPVPKGKFCFDTLEKMCSDDLLLKDFRYLSSYCITPISDQVLDESWPEGPAHVSQKDKQELIDSGIYENLSEKLPRKRTRKLKGRSRAFTVTEVLKERRRWILWPRALNKAIKKAMRYGKSHIGDCYKKARVVSGHKYVRCFDLSAAFYLVPLSEKVGDTMLLKIGKDYYRPTRLPMGVTFAPDLMQVIMMILAEPHKYPSVNIEIHIDNVRFTSASEPDLNAAVQNFKDRLVQAGVDIEALKEESPNLFLGMEIHYEPTSIGKVKVSTYEKMTDSTKQLMQDSTTVGDFREAVSRILYVARMLDVPMANHYMFLKNARRRYQEIYKNNLDELDMVHTLWPCTKACFKRLLADIQRRQEKGVSFTRKITAEPDVIIFTDSSVTGWGAVMIQGGLVSEASGKWDTKMTSGDMVMLEAEAVRKAFDLWNAELVGKNVRLCIDSTSVKHALRKGYSKSFETNEVIRKTLPLTRNFGQVSIVHVASKENAADLLSRGKKLVELSSYLGAGQVSVEADSVMLFG